MGRLSDEYMNTTCFLYPSMQEALHPVASSIGATGFFVTIKSDVINSLDFTYVITNAHVIEKLRLNLCERVVLRINSHDGLVETIETDINKWFLHPDGDDVAAFAIDWQASWKTKTIPCERFFLSKEVKDKYGIGIGDDTYTFGRFAPHSGVVSNLISARFGKISMDPIEPVKQSDRNDYPQESYLVESYSINGYSGSPVFVEMEPDMRSAPERLPERTSYLLGVDWGHFNITGVPTGMMGVVPAWKIRELLDIQEFLVARNIVSGWWANAFENLGVDVSLQQPDLDDDLRGRLVVEYQRIKTEMLEFSIIGSRDANNSTISVLNGDQE